MFLVSRVVRIASTFSCRRHTSFFPRVTHASYKVEVQDIGNTFGRSRGQETRPCPRQYLVFPMS